MNVKQWLSTDGWAGTSWYVGRKTAGINFCCSRAQRRRCSRLLQGVESTLGSTWHASTRRGKALISTYSNKCWHELLQLGQESRIHHLIEGSPVHRRTHTPATLTFTPGSNWDCPVDLDVCLWTLGKKQSNQRAHIDTGRTCKLNKDPDSSLLAVRWQPFS